MYRHFAGVVDLGQATDFENVLRHGFRATLEQSARISLQDHGSRRRIRVRKRPLWSEKRSHCYGLREEQVYDHEDQPEP
jgi:hypothetical protein